MAPPSEHSHPVLIRLDEGGTTAAVRLRATWRRDVGPEGLSAAVLRALAAAQQEHLVAALAADPPAPPDVTPPSVDVLLRAIGEIDEFRSALAASTSSTRTVERVGGHVRVTIQRNAITELDVAPEWVGHAGDAELEREIGATLTEALQRIAAAPADALAGCPGLRAVLRTVGSPLVTAEER
ncbi:hypothetical protein [Pseudonocardia thermophila]|jgi:hypothetical protein|uniref:hypothetical protein n=1 Tax=Pseudonocardia thermophila TaxID=1848 RepID=UPI00248F1848|nr:hypothetical protein [Pseudonocardia thermophila]